MQYVIRKEEDPLYGALVSTTCRNSMCVEEYATGVLWSKKYYKVRVSLSLTIYIADMLSSVFLRRLPARAREQQTDLLGIDILLPPCADGATYWPTPHLIVRECAEPASARWAQRSRGKLHSGRISFVSSTG